MSVNDTSTPLGGHDLVTARRATTSEIEILLTAWAELAVAFEDITSLHEDVRLQRTLGGWPFAPTDEAALSGRESAVLLEIAGAESETTRARADAHYAASLASLMDRLLPDEELAA